MEVGRVKVEGIGADGARRNAGGPAHGHAQMGEVATYPGPVEEGVGRRRLGRGDAVGIGDIGLDPVEDRQHLGPARLGPLIADKPLKAVRGAIAAGPQIGQGLARQLGPAVLVRGRGQALERAVVDHRLVHQADVAGEARAQGAGAIVGRGVGNQFDARGAFQPLFQNGLARPAGGLDQIDGIRRRLEAVGQFGAYAQLHEGVRQGPPEWAADPR